jgi:hypothetical protein
MQLKTTSSRTGILETSDGCKTDELPCHRDKDDLERRKKLNVPGHGSRRALPDAVKDYLIKNRDAKRMQKG